MNGPTNITVAPLHALGNATLQRLPPPAVSSATPSATDTATPSLKLLAERWFQRNAARNDRRNTNAENAQKSVAQHLSQNRPCATPGAADLAERAALVEEGAKVPRAWAEAFARLEFSATARGHALDAAGHALDAWAWKADALGWRADELLTLASEGEVVALTADAVTLRTPAGVRHVRRTD